MIALIARLYCYAVILFIGLAVRYARRRGRVVHYTHKGRLYMTRYALWGHLTGDGQAGFRARLPNLYLHQMHAPDLDPAVHDHPWPWALSWVMLGGYCEERAPLGPDRQLERTLTTLWHKQRWLQAPAINALRGSTFHRLAALADEPTFTLFLAGPRAGKKPWGYLVEGRGYVSHQERHAEFEGQELREPGPVKKATGKYLDALGALFGLERRKRCRLFGLLSESDKAFRSRMAEIIGAVNKRSTPEHFWSGR